MANARFTCVGAELACPADGGGSAHVYSGRASSTPTSLCHAAKAVHTSRTFSLPAQARRPALGLRFMFYRFKRPELSTNKIPTQDQYNGGGFAYDPGICYGQEHPDNELAQPQSHQSDY